MTSLKTKLIKMGNKNPSLRKDLKPVLNYLFVKSSANKKIARKIEDTISGRLMFAPTPLASRQIHQVLDKYDLDIKISSLFVDEPHVVMSITLETPRDEVLSDEEVEELAQELKQNLEGAAYRDLRANGYWSDRAGNAIVILKQRY